MNKQRILTPPSEIQQQFVEDAFQKSPIAPTELPLLDSVDAACRDHAWTQGLASEKFHSHGGNSPLGCIYHSRNSNRSCSFAKSDQPAPVESHETPNPMRRTTAKNLYASCHVTTQ
jgi:hypothetical protein